MTLSWKKAIALTLTVMVVTDLVGCGGDNKVAVPTKTDQPLPPLVGSGGGVKKIDAGGPNQKAE